MNAPQTSRSSDRSDRKHWTRSDELGSLDSRIVRLERKLGVSKEPGDTLERRVFRLEVKAGLRKPTIEA